MLQKKLNYNNFKITCYMNVKIDKISEISSFFCYKRSTLFHFDSLV